jgi:hypothetical protein
MDKVHLVDKLGQVQEDMMEMKANTTLLEGEKKGLEKVLKVKTAFTTSAAAADDVDEVKMCIIY